MIKKPSFIRITALLALVLTVCAVLSCGNEKNPPDNTSASAQDSETLPESTAEATTENPDEMKKPGYEIFHKKLYRTTLDWGHGYGTLPNGKTSFWNVKSCIKLEANMTSVYPYYRQNGSEYACAVLFPELTQSVFDYCLPTLEYSHENGVEVVTSLPNVLMNQAHYTKFGMNWQDYAMVNPRGLYSTSSDKKYAYACINNDKYQKLLHDYTIAACQAGYDGMFFDGGSYSYGLMYNCCCDYCKATWKEYSLKYLGKETEIPTTAPSHTTKASRVFWKMRMDIYTEFIMNLWEECKAINPNFGVWPNLGINGFAEPYYTLHGLTTTITEYGATSLVNCGYDSTLYMFRQYEAENPKGMLISQFNSIPEQASPDYKWRTAFAEAYAGGGSLMMPVSSTGTVKFFPEISWANAIIDAEPEMLTDSASAADVAIVYSWQEMNYCHMMSTGTADFNKNLPRKIAAAFAQNGIPFDYIMPENTDKLYQLLRYGTIVLPEFNLLTDDFAEMLRKYVEKGGELLILGKTFGQNRIIEEGVEYEKRKGDLLEEWTGKTIGELKAGEILTIGKGRIACVTDWVSGTTEKKAKYSEDLLKAFETLGLYDRVRVSADVNGYIETTVRSNADSTRWWLHLINNNCEGKWLTDRKVTLTLTLEDGETVTAVKGSAVHLTDDALGLTWKQEGNLLTIEAANNLWTIITIDKHA